MIKQFAVLAFSSAVLMGCATSKAPKPEVATRVPAVPAAQSTVKVPTKEEAERATEVLIQPPVSTMPTKMGGGAAPAAQSEPAPPAAPAVASRDEIDVDRVSKAINRIETLKAEFTQIDSNGLEQGRFYLDRPGRLRFEYDSGNLLVVANRDHVVVIDAKVSNPYRAKIEETPLRLLLMPNIDLKRDAQITQVRREDGLLMVSAAETEGYGQGHITFFFAEPTLDLLRWIVTDPVGNQTTVTLRNQQLGLEFDQDLFDPPSGIVFGNE